LSALSAAAAPTNEDPLLQLLHERGVSTAEAVTRPVREFGSEVVMAALNLLDVRYRRGGNSADEGFDCSGFTRHVFDSVLGLQLPHRSADQARQAGLLHVEREALKPGDLVFFNTLRRTFSHVGIYIGEGKFIHAPRSGQQVRVEEMDNRYWARRFDGARRAAPP
jgi:cell wall-associated NlpC family hydrolase